MAEPVVRSFPVFYNGKKVAEAFSNDADVNPNRNPAFGAEGLLAHTKGTVLSTLSFQYVIPVAGTSLNFLQDTVFQNDIEIGLPVGGIYVAVTMAITNCKMTSNVETGKCEGNLTLSGGKPVLA